jgi:hypothetical protein
MHPLLAQGNLFLKLGELSGHEGLLLLLHVDVLLKLNIVLLKTGLDLVHQVPILLVHGLHQDGDLTPES